MILQLLNTLVCQRGVSCIVAGLALMCLAKQTSSAVINGRFSESSQYTTTESLLVLIPWPFVHCLITNKGRKLKVSTAICLLRSL